MKSDRKTQKLKATQKYKKKQLASTKQKLNEEMKNFKEHGVQHVEKLKLIFNTKNENVNGSAATDATGDNREKEGWRYIHGKWRPPVQDIPFVDPTKPLKATPSTCAQSHQETKTMNRERRHIQRKYSINKLKTEVQKFGISGMEKTDREKATQAIAVKLGAVQKKQHIDLKTYIELKKKGNLSSLEIEPKKEKKIRRGKKFSDHIDGQVGKFKDGVQVLSSQDIQRIRSTKVKKN